MSDLKNLRKLCIMNAKESESDDQIRSICEEFGRVIKFNRPTNKRLAFPLFQNASEAKNAKEGLSAKGYAVDYANEQRADNGSEDGGRGNRSEFRHRNSPRNSNQASSDHGGIDFAEADSTDDNRPYGICLRCGDKAYHTCSRCGDFYCSEECQASDWLTHKRNCFPMPKLVPAKSMQSLHASRGNLVKSTEKIQIHGNNHVMNTTDAADGHEKVESPPSRKVERSSEKVEPPQPSNHVVPSVKPSPPPSQHLDDKLAVDKIAMVKKEASEPAESLSLSPRQKVLQLSNGSRSPVVGVNGAMVSTIANDSEVYITHVKNNACVYIRSNDTNTEFQSMIAAVDIASRTAPKLKAYPLRSELVMAPFEGVYYRAMVINSNESTGTVRVGYYDFGNSQEVAFSSLKVLPTVLQEQRRYTVMVGLKNVETDADPNEILAMTNYLENLSENKLSTLLKIKGSKPEIEAKDKVELFEVVSSQSVNETLNGMVKKRYRISDLKQKIMNSNNDLLMVIGSERVNENIITCVAKGDVGVFMAGDEKTQTYGASVKPAPAYKPKEKELCIVKINECEGEVWYRCMYQQELVEDRAQVYCIDYGKINNVRANNIRAMTSDLDHEITSFVCRIKNGDSVSPEARAKKFAEEPEFQPKSIDFDGDIHLISVEF